jgi:hypothetical protein
MICDWIKIYKNDVKILKPSKNLAEDTLIKLQLSTNSVLGSIVYNTSGILINNGWIRLLGSGEIGVRSIIDWNEITSIGECNKIKNALLVADDVMGGFFAINSGAFKGNLGNVFYLAPDTLEWEDLEITYSQFIKWALTEQTDKFYESFRWTNWVEKIKNIDINHGLLVYPFIWAEGEAIENRPKKDVPISELWSLTLQNQKKMG